MRQIVARIAFGVLLAIPAAAAIIVFSFADVVPVGTIPNGYGFTGGLAVSYKIVPDLKPLAPTSIDYMLLWGSSYGDLTDVAYGTNGSYSVVSLTPLNAPTVNLIRFDF